MRTMTVFVALFAACVPALEAWAAEPALTIYNQSFAVVREMIHLDLQQGLNQVSVSDTTAHLEPDSVILRDPAGQRDLQIVEQNYRADPLSEGLLLQLNEGKTIDFVISREGREDIVSAKIVRSAYAPHPSAMNRYGREYAMMQQARAYGQGSEPLVQMPDGTLRFGLPGKPVFPSIPDDTILKPTLSWSLMSEAAGPLDAEFSYVTGGMNWEASYNLVGTDKDEALDVVGWVTVDNQSGKSFADARIKLMAGEVSKIRRPDMQGTAGYGGMGGGMGGMMPPVTEKAFDEYHLYTIQRPTTLLDRETKQVEMVRADGVKSEKLFVYDGVKIDPNRYYQGYSTENLIQDREYGTQSQTSVWVMREIKNTAENGLGIPLPAGRTRFYQRDEDGQLEFTGENTIKHTAKDETLKIYTGSAFDLVGERTRTNFVSIVDQHFMDESFQIKLRNHKDQPVEIRVVEHMYRHTTWEIREPSDPFTKTDSRAIEFRVNVPPGEEKTVSYVVHYSW
ncbi:MAG TPA: DUF4139 domain-containing protein [Candidatus Bathyarchaeia archaeon]|nr:DUF4139 domain-containing protein [Candidatus Bathyarchaeia archaeon]